MDLVQKKYLIGYIAVVIPLALSFLFMRRGSKPPVQLRLKTNPEAGKPPPAAEPATKVLEKKPADSRPASKPTPPPRGEVSLNALFNWNGHTWDSYEVLGVPAGSSLESVHSAYQKILVNSDQDSKPFFKAAFDAISRLS